MNLKEIKEELLRAVAFVEDFGVYRLEIDRDAALCKMRQAYEALRFMKAEDIEPIEDESLLPIVVDEDDEPEIEVEFVMLDEADDEEEKVEAEPEVESEPVVAPIVEEEPEPEAEPEPEVEDEPEVEVEPVVEPEPEVEAVDEVVEQSADEDDFDIDAAFEPEEYPEEEEPIVEIAEEIAEEPTSAPIVESEPIVEPTRVIVEQSLFGDFEPMPRKATTSRRKIMALYEDDPAPAPKVEPAPVVEPEPVVESTPAPTPIVEPEPIIEPEPIVESEPVVEVAPEPIAEPKVVPILEGENKVLGEVIAPAAPTIADTMTPVTSVAEDRPVDTLRGAVSVADRFMLIRDLFAGDAEQYEKTMDVLEAMDNLDDCIIYIAENFAWRPSSDGAKLIMDLLQRKLA